MLEGKLAPAAVGPVLDVDSVLSPEVKVAFPPETPLAAAAAAKSNPPPSGFAPGGRDVEMGPALDAVDVEKLEFGMEVEDANPGGLIAV